VVGRQPERSQGEPLGCRRGARKAGADELHRGSL
jgi:hypothetical protein